MKNKGFTLVETLLAMIILSSAIVLLSNSWSGSFMRQKKTKTVNEVSYLIERKMAEIELEYRGKPLDSIPEEKEDTFGDAYPNYSWKLTSKEFVMPDLSSMFTSQDGGADQMLLNIIGKFTEHLSKSVKEVKLTVIVKGKPKNIEYSIVTYFVDQNKEIAL